MIIFFDVGIVLAVIGGIAVLLMLYALGSFGEVCAALATFMENHTDIIVIIFGIIVLILAIAAFFRRTGSIAEKLSVAVGEALASSQFLFGMVYGFYQVIVTFKSKEGLVATTFFFIMTLLMYIVAQVVNTLLTGYITVRMIFDDDYNAWYNIGACVLGIGSWIYQIAGWASV